MTDYRKKCRKCNDYFRPDNGNEKECEDCKMQKNNPTGKNQYSKEKKEFEVYKKAQDEMYELRQLALAKRQLQSETKRIAQEFSKRLYAHLGIEIKKGRKKK